MPIANVMNAEDLNVAWIETGDNCSSSSSSSSSSSYYYYYYYYYYYVGLSWW
jgi:hypothetical protein